MPRQYISSKSTYFHPINVRTDGNALYAARRVDAGYQFVTYGPIALAARSDAGQ